MSTHVWKKLGSPELSPSTITLHAYYDHPSQLVGLYQNCPITLASKQVFIDIEVIDPPLDYNLFLGRSFIYAMKETISYAYHIMSFPHNGKVVNIYQLTYYNP